MSWTATREVLLDAAKRPVEPHCYMARLRTCVPGGTKQQAAHWWRAVRAMRLGMLSWPAGAIFQQQS